VKTATEVSITGAMRYLTATEELIPQLGRKHIFIYLLAMRKNVYIFLKKSKRCI
jgi:hypothetical protein